MQSGLGGPDGDIESVRDFREREPEVVVEDQHGSLLHGEATDPAVELVSIDDRMDVVRGEARLGREGADVRRVATGLPSLLVARACQGAMEPRLESIWFTERSKVAPRADVRGLDSILGEIDVAQDPIRDADAAIAGGANQRFEGVLVASLRLLDQTSIHCSLRVVGASS